MSNITFEPAECWAGCTSSDCPYSHFDTYRCDDGSAHFTRRDAESWIAASKGQDNGEKEETKTALGRS